MQGKKRRKRSRKLRRQNRKVVHETTKEDTVLTTLSPREAKWKKLQEKRCEKRQRKEFKQERLYWKQFRTTKAVPLVDKTYEVFDWHIVNKAEAQQQQQQTSSTTTMSEYILNCLFS